MPWPRASSLLCAQSLSTTSVSQLGGPPSTPSPTTSTTFTTPSGATRTSATSTPSSSNCDHKFSSKWHSQAVHRTGGSSGHQMCAFGWGDVSHYAIWANLEQAPPYQVLLDAGYHWTNPNPNGTTAIQLPPNSIDGGAAGTVAGNEHTYVCEAL